MYPQEFLNAHNAARKEVGVPPMVWDNLLEAYALHYSQGRVDNSEPIHSVGPSGQNLAWGSSPDLTPTKAVSVWVNEKNDYNLMSGIYAQGMVCDHYTQVIWINSTQLGCVTVECQVNGTFITCYYYPPGKRPTDGLKSLVKALAPAPPVSVFPPKEDKNMRVGLVIGATALILGLMFMVWFISRRKRKREKEVDDQVLDLLLDDEFGNGMGPRRFLFNELAKATNNFDGGNKLGEGGFWF